MLYDDTNIHESINSPARAPLAGAPYNPGVSLAGTDEDDKTSKEIVKGDCY